MKNLSLLLFFMFLIASLHAQTIAKFEVDAGEMAFGNRYTLQYRVITFDGRWTAEQARKEWINFSNPPAIQVIQ